MVGKTGVGGNNGVVGKTVVGVITGWSEKRGWG